jgi:hypothetical protein
LTLTKCAFDYRFAQKLIRILRRENTSDEHTPSFAQTRLPRVDRRPNDADRFQPVRPSAQASYIVTLEQVGSNVVATGSGSIDLTDLTFQANFTSSNGAQISPDANVGYIETGPTTAEPINGYRGFTGPFSFGTAAGTRANSGSGNTVAIEAFDNTIIEVPQGYVSGNPLSDSATYDNETIAKLGATPGTYVWTWGSGADADSFTLQIGAVPAPVIGRGLPVLLAIGGLLFGAKLLERSKRRKLQIG